VAVIKTNITKNVIDLARSVVVILMATLGIYWSVIAYVEWTDSPVITTVETTAFAINNVPFPAVTICAPGFF
jgi:hypothetical protein